MPFRKFCDADGVEWQVWSVVPRVSLGHESWEGIDRRSPDPVLGCPGVERRRAKVPAAPLLSPGLEAGWLTFESATEKRRIAPIPPGWDEGDDRALEALCRTARVVMRSPQP